MLNGFKKLFVAGIISLSFLINLSGIVCAKDDLIQLSSDADSFLFENSDGSGLMRIMKDGNVGIGIGTSTPTAKLEIMGNLKIRNKNNKTSLLRLMSVGSTWKSDWQIFTGSTNGGVQTTDLAFWANNKPQMVIQQSGNVGIGTSEFAHSSAKFEVNTGINQNFVVRGPITLASGVSLQAIQNDQVTDTNLEIYTGDGQNSQIQLHGNPITFYNNGERVRITSNGNVGIGTDNPTEKLEVNGTTKTKVLVITGGADLSENFDVHGTKTIVDDTKEIPAQPGMVVSIDAENPGKLVVSTRAYDRTVAGIISGAGGIATGMQMGQKGTAADGELPVALTGRVYCYADASYGAIEPGDMLTTSDTPGHAMKVSDYEKAQGSIIGKAMTTLEGGKGLVLTLVSLQ